MKVVFHEKFYDTDYALNGASVIGRMEAIMVELNKQYEVIKPVPVSRKILESVHSIDRVNTVSENAKDYLKIIEDYVSSINYVDIIAISAGFDSYIKDLGKKLKTFDFYLIGRMMKKMAKKFGHNRCFAVLEGGYYLPDLGKNVLAFCQGLE